MSDRAVINVCFHGIGKPSRELESGESRYWITLPQFESILDEIASWPSMQVSFDDGNRSDVEFGLPAVLERGLTATFFVLAGRLHTAGSLNAVDIVDLCAAGMTVGSHGMDHRSWRAMDSMTRRRELIAAREQISEIAGYVVDRAALPLGQYDRRLLSHLKEVGYKSVYTSDRRPARAGSWLQPRFSVRSEDSPQTLRQAVLAARKPRQRLQRETAGFIKRLR